MRRYELVQAINRVANDLTSAGLVKFFEQIFERSRTNSEKDAPIPFQYFTDYLLSTSNYGPAEHAVCEIFDLQSLQNPAFYAILYHSPEPGMVYETRNSIRFAINYAPKIAELFKQDDKELVINNSSHTPEQLRGKDLLTLIIPEDEGQFSSPDRIIAAIQSINEFYFVISTINKHDPNDLILLSCDSGSDKSFDFTGLPQIILGVKETVTSIWDRVVFHRHSQAHANLSLISASLPIIAQINEMESNNQLGPEIAERLRMKIESSSDGFIKAGATIPEIDAVAAQSPRVLLKPSTRLIAGPSISKNDNDIDNNSLEIAREDGDLRTDGARDAENLTLEALRAQVDALTTALKDQKIQPAKKVRTRAKRVTKPKSDAQR